VLHTDGGIMVIGGGGGELLTDFCEGVLPGGGGE